MSVLPASIEIPPGPLSQEGRTVAFLRRALLALTAAGIVGTVLELASFRHWKSAVQLVPWFALGALTVALVAMVRRPTAVTVKAVRVVAVVVMIMAAFGVLEHVLADYRAGQRNPRYAARWATMSPPARWWAAASGGVGNTPPLAPAVLAETALTLALATVGASRRDPVF